jgi:4-hydroxybenzoate polyprenyltransferase
MDARQRSLLRPKTDAAKRSPMIRKLWTLCFVVLSFLVDVFWLHWGVLYLLGFADRMDARQRSLLRPDTDAAKRSPMIRKLWTLCFVVFGYLVDVYWLHWGVLYLLRFAGRMDARQQSLLPPDTDAAKRSPMIGKLWTLRLVVLSCFGCCNK